MTLNLDCEDGLINRAACIVQKIKLTEIPYASGIIWVKFPSENTENFLRQNKKHLYSKEIHTSWTPIEPATRQFAAGYKNESQIQRMQFPLRPAAAKTIHRSQGDTLNKNKVSINSAVKKEMERLRKKLPATSVTFLNEITNKYRIVFLNANSLHKHIEDVRSDYSLISEDLTCFCETRILPSDNDYLTKLQNFHTYRQESIAPQGRVDGYPIDVNSKTIESSLIQLQYPINDLLVCFLYRPPKTPIKSLLTHLNNLEIKYFTRKEVIIMKRNKLDF
ncbi:unnamed protein product [Mytilus coruscus]|uniref:Uncharacterized protein n=1 Tax=Mytilus coruscus TaxID=42192 RepID=A0A6J8BPJ4_MYTCO|nr:unnamed protein product [Mytilus coruscus]